MPRGGRRPGAGRPKKSPEASIAELGEQLCVKLLQELAEITSREADLAERAATLKILLAAYRLLEPAAGSGGKKQAQAAAAAAAARSGRFAIPPPPKLVIDNGTRGGS